MPSEGPFGHYKIVAGGVVIAEVFGGSHQPQAVRAQALKNACLIATAPELLAQLKLILEECKKANDSSDETAVGAVRLAMKIVNIVFDERCIDLIVKAEGDVAGLLGDCLHAASDAA